MAPVQTALPFAPTKAKRPTCRTCGLTVRAKRCRFCAKHDIPEPGMPLYDKWRRGIMTVIRHRLDDAGHNCDTITAAWLWVTADGPEPAAEVRAIIADCKAAFMTPRRFYEIVQSEVKRMVAEAKSPAAKVAP